MREAEKIFRRMKIDSESIASHFMPEIPTVTLLLLVIDKQSYHCVVAMALSHTFNCSSHAQTGGKCNKWILLLRLSFWVVRTNVTTQITNGQQISMGTLRYFQNNNNNKRLASNDHSKFTIMNELYLYVYCWRCIKYLCSPVNALHLTCSTCSITIFLIFCIFFFCLQAQSAAWTRAVAHMIYAPLKFARMKTSSTLPIIRFTRSE